MKNPIIRAGKGERTAVCNSIMYYTRDADGNDFIKEVKIKKYKPYVMDLVCPLCHCECSTAYKVKDIVSANFTEWAYMQDYVCENCADMFSLYFYNYIVNPNGIKLINIRQIKDEITKEQSTPFIFVITTSQKKHLFYKSIRNENPDVFAVSLETEIIWTTRERMKVLFDFVECLQTLGQSKDKMKAGEIRYDILKKIGLKSILHLQKELRESREIQVPLYCGQKREITEEEAICIINSTHQA